MRPPYPDDEVYIAFVQAAYAEAGYPVTSYWTSGPESLTIVCEPFPPCAVVWKVASLADQAGVDDLSVCWPCYRFDQDLTECPHDWRTSPQPSRDELVNQ